MIALNIQLWSQLCSVFSNTENRRKRREIQNRMSYATALWRDRNRMMAMVNPAWFKKLSDWKNSQHKFSLWVMKYKWTTPPCISQPCKSVEAWGAFCVTVIECLFCYSYILPWPQQKQDTWWVDSDPDKDSHSWVFVFHSNPFAQGSLAVLHPDGILEQSWVILAWNMDFRTRRDMWIEGTIFLAVQTILG